MARCRRNVDNFLDACRKIGVDEVRNRLSLNAHKNLCLDIFKIHSGILYYILYVVQCSSSCFKKTHTSFLYVIVAHTQNYSLHFVLLSFTFSKKSFKICFF